ncbi:MAG: lysylphosphatidylglycerol synthase transmembrane domain-containing protein [Patescibacteria group bacterium]
MSTAKSKHSIRIILALGLIVFLVLKIDMRDTLALFLQITWQWLLIILIFRGIGLLFNIFRWRMILECHTHSISWWELLKARLVGLFYNNILPSNSGGDMVRAYFLTKREDIPLSETFSTVVIEKVSGIIALVTYLIIAFFLNASVIHDAGVTSLIIILSVLAGIAIVLLFNNHLFELCASLAKKKSNKVTEVIYKYYKAINHFTKHPDILVWSVIYSLIVQGTTIGVTYAAAQSLSLPLGLQDVFLLVPLIGLSNAIPVSIGNWGWREGVYVFILQFFSVEAHLALALALLMRLLGFAISIFGGVVVMSKQGRFRLRTK